MTWLRWIVAVLVPGLVAFAALAARSLAGPKDERARKRALIKSALPGWDCGACGSDDCGSFADRLASDASALPACGSLGREGSERIRSMLGVTAPDGSVAVVACAGAETSVRARFGYVGLATCRGSASFYGGHRGCSSSCLGFGDCLGSCPLGAISIGKGLARIDPDLCDGCGDCVSSCPNGVIRIVRDADAWFVACNSRDAPASKTATCDAACDACRICERLSGNGEFRVQDDLAYAVPVSTGTHAEIAVSCPKGVIRTARGAKPSSKGSESGENGKPGYRKPAR